MRDELIVLAVRCKRLVVRVAHYDGSFVVVAVRLIVRITMFCDGSFGVIAVRC